MSTEDDDATPDTTAGKVKSDEATAKSDEANAKHSETANAKRDEANAKHGEAANAKSDEANAKHGEANAKHGEAANAKSDEATVKSGEATNAKRAPIEPPAMPRWQRAYVIAMCAIIGGAFAYAACEWGQWPRVRYEVLAERLTFEETPAIAIVYWGIAAWGLCGALCGALVGAVLCRLVPRAWPDRVLHLFGAWAITAIFLAGGYFTWGLWPWS